MNLFKNKVFIAFISFLLIVIMYLSVSSRGIFLFLGNVIGITTVPFEQIASSADGKVKDILVYFNDIKYLKEENDKLRKKLSEEERKNRELIEYRQKIGELRQALSIKEKFYNFDMAGANVIAKEPTNWFNTFTVDIGTKDSVELSSPVINGEGLVGRVIKVDMFTSQIVSIIDPQSTVSARISKSRDLVVVRGDLALMNSGLCRMDYIPNDTDLVEGDIIETSGLGGIYPKGIVIGKVSKIEQSDNEFTKKAEILPSVDLKRIEEVFILRKKGNT